MSFNRKHLSVLLVLFTPFNLLASSSVHSLSEEINEHSARIQVSRASNLEGDQVSVTNTAPLKTQSERDQKFAAYWKSTPKVQERDGNWRESFIVRLVRTEAEIQSKETFAVQGFALSYLKDVIVNIEQNKNSFSIFKTLTLINLAQEVLPLIESILREINPYFIDVQYMANIPIDPFVMNFYNQLKAIEDAKYEGMEEYIDEPQLDYTSSNPQEEEEEFQNFIESNGPAFATHMSNLGQFNF